MPKDSTSLVRSVINQLDPFRSFEEILLEMDLSAEELLRVVRHLLYWRQGILIFPVNNERKYRMR